MVLAGDVLSSRGGPIVSAWKTTLVVECHLERCLRLPCVIICILSHLSIIILPVDYANFGSRVHLCIYTKRSVWCTVYVMLKNSYDTEFQPKLLQDTYSIRLREKSPWIYYSMLTLTLRFCDWCFWDCRSFLYCTERHLKSSPLLVLSCMLTHSQKTSDVDSEEQQRVECASTTQCSETAVIRDAGSVHHGQKSLRPSLVLLRTNLLLRSGYGLVRKICHKS